MENKQTAVMWLENELKTRPKPIYNSDIDKIFEQAKAMEREQIEELSQLRFQEIHTVTSPKHTKMEKTVKNCWNCPFLSFVSGEFYCEHMDIDSNGFLVSEYSLSIIHPNCPEKGAFIIKTQKIKDDNNEKKI